MCVCVCVCVCDVCVQVHAIQEQYYASVKRAQRVARNDSQLKSLFSQVLRAIAPNPQVLVAACAVVAYGSGMQFPTLVLSLKVALALVCRMWCVWETAFPDALHGRVVSKPPC